jgi:hypothetical protein
MYLFKCTSLSGHCLSVVADDVKAAVYKVETYIKSNPEEYRPKYSEDRLYHRVVDCRQVEIIDIGALPEGE